MPTFSAKIEKNWIMRCVIVPPAVMRALGNDLRIPVLAEYLGEKFQTTVMPAGRGRGRLTILAEAVRRAKLTYGDRIEVTLNRSTESREPIVPPDLLRALQFKPAAREAFQKGPVSQRRWVVHYIEQARRPETRASYIERAVENLAARKSKREANVSSDD